MPVIHIVIAAVGAVLIAATSVGFLLSRRKMEGGALTGRQRKRKKLWLIGLLISVWGTVGALITIFSGKKGRLAIEFEMFSPRVPVFGITLAKTTLIGCGVLVFLAVLLLLFRFTAVPRFSEEDPGGLQNAMEAAVDAVDRFVENTTSEMTVKGLSPYMISVALYIMGCAFSEMLGLRTPTSDLTFTLCLGLCTLALINIYGFKKGGVGGRIKNMGGPVPAMRVIMVPLKAVTDLAVPISLACRLFGNMLGGMLVMDLFKGVLGGYGAGLPAVAGIYFNLLHPMLQIYIFVSLSLTYIQEAME
ncbi:MAG: F0F1 ATP synthase subunit A [Clostridia bacterium]|nr:F0F1 ATP synthase subunit A [Clostridia bacterium]